ncbi:transcriptional corepressor LEUNIG-like isoform X2 [Corylus avellana]|uniref:transcriptional corepressor LEUNIG-like isoform X2 n=1 Tax=Corylus avellana TaxID=13451 RepID=UPI00286AF4F5|nr:transcriptional corepressor LEUNIG-like isoform X2 [Corylus avellana]
MASGDPWKGWNPAISAMMFDVYLHDYLVKKKMHKTAEIFKNEARLDVTDRVAIDTPEGFLLEWWSLFSDVYSYSNALGSVKDTQMTENEQQKINSRMPQSAMNQYSRGQSTVITDFDKTLGQSAAYLLTAKSHPEQQTREQQAQQLVVRESRNDIGIERTVPMNSMLYGPHDAGMLEGINSASLDGWPLTEPNCQQHFQTLTPEVQQALMAQVLSRMHENQTSTFPGSPANFDSPNLMLPQMELSAKDRQMMVQMKQTAEHQWQHDPLEQQNSRKSKTRLYSRAADNMVDHINADDTPVDVESFLSHNDENAGGTSPPFSSLKHHSIACTKDEHEVCFKFEEVVTLHSSKNKVLCCHFSSDGKLLASAGHENKVSIWNLETFSSINTSEEHSLLVSDVRFRPCSTIFATSSFDRTVKIWDAATPSVSLCKLLGHAEQVMSVDFHPRKLDLLCSCDRNNEIRLWSVIENACKRVSKGATKQVRFQPQLGNVLATAAGNSVYVIDVETDGLQFYFQGHVKDIISICWDTSGNYIASVSEDSARIWSAVSGGKCIHELHSNGNKFQSCTFHPGYSQLLIIGGYQFLELWNPTVNNKTLLIPAHDGLIAGLADSPQTEMVASASHDHCVKLWK